MNEIQMSSRQKAFIFLLIIGIAVLIGVWRTQEAAHPEIQHALVLPEPKPISTFSFYDQYNRPFTEENLKGQWTFLFFGYTHCPDICPMTLTVMNSIATQLPEGAAQFVFISADPERDDADQLRTYLEHINSTFIGASGLRPEIHRLAKSLNLYLSNENDPEATFIDHSSALLLINPRLELVAIFTPPSSAEEIAHDFLILQKKSI